MVLGGVYISDFGPLGKKITPNDKVNGGNISEFNMFYAIYNHINVHKYKACVLWL